MIVSWTALKPMIDVKLLVNVHPQYLEDSDNIYVFVADGALSASCIINKNTHKEEVEDFNTNYKDQCNISVLPRDAYGSPIVTTQYEKDDKDLKLARAQADVDPNTMKAVISIRIPGTFGTKDGRWIAGGYAFTSDYRADDYALVYVKDTDRNIAWALALAADPEASEPLSDETVQGMGTIPGFGAFPIYPIVKSYTDDDLPAENRGWYFWPRAQGSSLAPIGECEVEPIGGYGFAPAGFDLVVEYIRTVTTGNIRLILYWGKGV